MQIVRHLGSRTWRRSSVLTLGNFDGVHVGHGTIMSCAVDEARRRDALSVVFTFEPHPVAVLAPERAPARIQTLHDRLARFRALGFDVAVVQRFTREFSRLSAEDFVTDILLAHFDVRHVVVGHRVSFGRGRSGDATTLRALGSRHGFTVDAIGPVTVGGEEVSSTAVRSAVLAGDMPRARLLLGIPWAIRGRVSHGDARGRTIGFPTANVHLRRGLVLPPDGVYAARARVGKASAGAVLNLGRRPTFAGRERTLEVHLLDFAGDLYGEWMSVEFLERLRGEERFADVDALRAAIERDVAAARRIVGDTES